MQEKWDEIEYKSMRRFSYENDFLENQDNSSWANEITSMNIATDGNTFYPTFDQQHAEFPNPYIFSHQLRLVNAYSINEFPTQFAPDNICTVDFIFVSQDIYVVKNLKLPSEEKLRAIETGLPNMHFPSDHQSLCTEFS